MSFVPEDKKDFLKLFKQFIRFCVIGVMGTLVHFAVLIALVEKAEVSVMWATTCAFCTATVVNFLGNRLWTFSEVRNVDGQFLRYFFVTLIGLSVNNFFMWLFIEIGGIHYLIAQVFTVFFVVFWNFFGAKYLVFKNIKINQKTFIPKSYQFDLTIIIPAFNEAERIKSTLRAVRDYLKGKDFSAEVLVINDCSTDRTAEIVQKFQGIKNLKLINHEKNRGKGGAIQTGFQEARGQISLFIDADNSTDITEFDKFIPALKKTPIVIGSRYLENSELKKSQGIARKVLSRIGNKLIRNILKFSIKDTQCGFKAFHTDVAKFLAERQQVNGFAFDIELLGVAHMHGVEVKEIAVTWKNSEATKVSFFKDSFRSLRDLAMIKIGMWGGEV